MTKLFRFSTVQNALFPTISGRYISMSAWVLFFALFFLLNGSLSAQTWVKTYPITEPVATAIQPITFGDTSILFVEKSTVSMYKNTGELKKMFTVSVMPSITSRIFGLAKTADNQGFVIAQVEYPLSASNQQTLRISSIDLNSQSQSSGTVINLPPASYFNLSLTKLDDGYLISDDGLGVLIKVNESGTVLWTNNITSSGVSGRSPIVLANKNILKFVLQNDLPNNRTRVYFTEVSYLNGQIVDSGSLFVPKSMGNFSQIVATKDNGIILFRNVTLSFRDRQIVASKIDLKRRYLQNQSFSPMKDVLYENSFRVQTDNDGNAYVTGSASTGTNTFDINNIYTMAFTPNASFRDSRFYKNFMPSPHDTMILALRNITVTPSGSLYLGGASVTSNFLIRLDSFGIRFPEVRGRIVRDNNRNCQADGGDTPLSNITVQAIGKRSGQRYFQTTDSLGNVGFGTLPIDTYRITAVTTNLLWQNCYEKTVYFDKTRDTTFGTLTVQPLTDCAVMQTDVTIPFLRRCFENTVYVSYQNIGSITATNARMTVKLDSLLEYISSTRPLSSRVGNLLTFQLGDVAETELNNFDITVRVKCGDSTRLGQTLCVEARVYPDSFCIGTSPNWTGASIAVTGSCQKDSVHFYIRNIGRGTTATGIKYKVIEDDIVFLQGVTPVLSPNASHHIRLPATGKTYRIIADQEINHPLTESQPTVAIEGCRRGGVTAFSTGFVNQFIENDASPSIDIDCRELRGSYDPNDKMGLPQGYDSQHFIQKNNDIEYMIRFQNTGTDTAFTVIIRDTLPYNQLDPMTVKVGASSHPYKWQIMDKGVLEFRFDNILLPDSFRNKLGSNGFVKFRISQKPNLAEGTKIENRAGIYFDFNDPIITNQTLHTIAITYKTQLRLDNDEVTVASKISVAPNPFGERTVIDIAQIPASAKETIFELFDLSGKVLRREKIQGNTFVFERKDLPTGLFIFKISTADGRLIGQGKVVAQ